LGGGVKGDSRPPAGISRHAVAIMPVSLADDAGGRVRGESISLMVSCNWGLVIRVDADWRRR
jgi:hypothetical protein